MNFDLDLCGKLEAFLNAVDSSFPVPISKKQNLKEYSCKLIEKATLCMEMQDDKIIALVAGYTENVIDSRAYISIVATLQEAQRKGFAGKLIKNFIQIAADKNLEAVHLYAVEGNLPALKMYQKLGFVEWDCPDETRKQDIHLIYYIKE